MRSWFAARFIGPLPPPNARQPSTNALPLKKDIFIFAFYNTLRRGHLHFWLLHSAVLHVCRCWVPPFAFVIVLLIYLVRDFPQRVARQSRSLVASVAKVSKAVPEWPHFLGYFFMQIITNLIICFGAWQGPIIFIVGLRTLLPLGSFAVSFA